MWTDQSRFAWKAAIVSLSLWDDAAYVERMARVLADAEYGVGTFDQFNDEERTISLAEASVRLRYVLSGVEDASTASNQPERSTVEHGRRRS